MDIYDENIHHQQILVLLVHGRILPADVLSLLHAHLIHPIPNNVQFMTNFSHEHANYYFGTYINGGIPTEDMTKALNQATEKLKRCMKQWKQAYLKGREDIIALCQEELDRLNLQNE
jgi:hypothetical protein